MNADSPRPSWRRPGTWLYHAWHRPLGWFERSWREGGPFEQWKTACGRAEMRRSTRTLEPVSVVAPQSDEPALALLTGSNYWEQTAFCLRSLQHATPGRIWTAFAVDDGSLEADQAFALERAFPGLRVVSGDQIEMALQALLPATQHPVLRSHRRAFKLLRKLTDIHAVRPGWNLVLDADMLFHGTPADLLCWFESPPNPIVLTDVDNAYGYSLATLATIARTSVPIRINTGICGLNSRGIDWKKLERQIATLLTVHGSSYFLEQALVALALSGTDFTQLSPERYRVKPSESETRSPTAVLHHYVADSKRAYFRCAWRTFASSPDNAALSTH